MKFQYLGTAAAEGWPAVFCRCEACEEAARRGGKNIRTRSQALINDDLLLDLPPDTYLHKLQQGLDLSAVAHLVITHWHMDHFYPQELTIRGGCYSHNMKSTDLHIYCGADAKEFFDSGVAWEMEKELADHLHWHILTAFQPVEAGPYRITPLPARKIRPLLPRHRTFQRGSLGFPFPVRQGSGPHQLRLHRRTGEEWPHQRPYGL